MLRKINLDDVREKLIALEDTIIRALIERAQYKTNDKAYIPGGIPIKDFSGSYFDFMFKNTEKVHALAGRYDAFDEHTFYRGNPDAVAKRKYVKPPIVDVELNLNPAIKLVYLNSIPLFCKKGDDGNYGDAIIRDIMALQAISHRVHYGMLVIEAKYQASPDVYNKLVKDNDEIGILRELTDTRTEKVILDIVRKKARQQGLNPKFIADFYKNQIIPLTKIVEVEYLFKRNNK